MRITLSLMILAGLLVTPANGDEEPCFFGTPAAIVTVESTEESPIRLSWAEIASAEWYEVMRCSASAGPCTLMSLTTTEASQFVDAETESSSHLWYRIVARTGPPADLCAPHEYCALPAGQCAGAGRCSLRSELCPPEYFEFVCSCGMRTFQNPCYSCAGGTNIRWWGTCSP